MRIVQINIKGISRAQAELISHLFNSTDILALQETKIADDHIERLKIPGFQLGAFQKLGQKIELHQTQLQVTSSKLQTSNLLNK